MNNEKDYSSRKGKLKERIKTITIIVLIIIIIILLLRGCSGEPNNTTQIIDDDKTTLQDTTGGEIRIKFSPVVTISNGVMEELNFCNYNENRILKLKIMVNGDYVYESKQINAGEILVSDLINTKSLQRGENEAIAEVYSYTSEGELMGQTNVEFKLDYGS